MLSFYSLYQNIISLILVLILAQISVCDICTMEIPDECSLAVAILAVGNGGFSPGIICLSIAILILTGLCMGFGDAKLFGALSLLFGWKVILIIAASFFLAAVYCILSLAFHHLHTHDFIAFAPFICIATIGMWANCI